MDCINAIQDDGLYKRWHDGRFACDFTFYIFILLLNFLYFYFARCVGRSPKVLSISFFYHASLVTPANAGCVMSSLCSSDSLQNFFI